MEVTQTSVRLEKPEAQALLAHASPDVARPFMAGVAVDLGRGRLYATDGHRLAMAVSRSDRVGPAFPPLVLPRERLEAAVRMVPAGGSLLLRLAPEQGEADPSQLAWPAGLVTVEVRDRHTAPIASLTIPCDPECKPPPVDQVIPPLGGDVAGFVSLNPAYLADLAKVAKAAGVTAIRCHAAPHLDPVRFEAAGETAWTVVIMPMREEPAPPVYRRLPDDEQPATGQALPEPAAPKRRRRKAA